jgi:phosphohistidine phosphatase
MKLYIMRHGPAEDYAASGRDGDRALTPSGRERVRDVARALLLADEAPSHIFSSPLVRALQTAEIVAATVETAHAVEIRREVAPGGAAMALIHELSRKKTKRVMLVGHEPDFSDLVARLAGATPAQGMLKAMVVGISVADGGQTKLRFILDPKTLAWERAPA